MARIRIKCGQNEVEIESKDFYIDNQTAGEIINNLSVYVKEGAPGGMQYEYSYGQEARNPGVLNMLEDAEVHEPEFVRPSPLHKGEIRDKIRTLVEDAFLTSRGPCQRWSRSCTSTAGRQYRLTYQRSLRTWRFGNELKKDLKDRRSYYSAARILELN